MYLRPIYDRWSPSLSFCHLALPEAISRLPLIPLYSWVDCSSSGLSSHSHSWTSHMHILTSILWSMWPKDLKNCLPQWGLTCKPWILLFEIRPQSLKPYSINWALQSYSIHCRNINFYAWITAINAWQSRMNYNDLSVCKGVIFQSCLQQQEVS